jgi:hypothetical protein
VRLRRRYDRLTYSVLEPTSQLLQVAEAFHAMTGRQSVAKWRRRCEASLRASQRRRGLR